MLRLGDPLASFALHDVLGNYLAALLSALSLWFLRVFASSRRRRRPDPGHDPEAAGPDEPSGGTPER